MKDNHISQLKDRKSPLDDTEWENILSHTLLQRSEVDLTKVKDDTRIEVAASIRSDKLSIVFRRNISGIIQRLGEITLKETQDLELDTVSWTLTAIACSEKLQAEVQDLTAKYESANYIIADLNKQLNDLILAKQEHEEAMLVKFRDLLNAKKSKIRDQQRLLTTAKVDPQRAEAIQVARGHTSANGKGRAAEASRSGKRKTRADADADEDGEESPRHDDEESEDAFEPVPTKSNSTASKYTAAATATAGDSENEQSDTPEASDDVTEDESEENDREPVRQKTKSHQGRMAKTTGQQPDAAAMEMDVDSLPPARTLPFEKGKTTAAGSQPSTSATQQRSNEKPSQQQESGGKDDDGDDEETTDDEL